eukprot:gene10410-64018_t
MAVAPEPVPVPGWPEFHGSFDAMLVMAAVYPVSLTVLKAFAASGAAGCGAHATQHATEHAAALPKAAKRRRSSRRSRRSSRQCVDDCNATWAL